MKRYSIIREVPTTPEGVVYLRQVSATVRTVPPTGDETSRAAEGGGVRDTLACRRENAPRVYISGPMTGLPEYNFPAFFAMARKLKERGFSVLNPAAWPARATYEEYLQHDIKMLIRYADAVVFLDGWEKSNGARVEMAVARALKLPVLFADQLDEVTP